MTTRSLLPLLLALALSGCQLWPFGGDDAPEEPVVAGEELPGQVIDPNIDRREVEIVALDDENFSLGSYSGILAVEDLGSDLVFGARVGYLVTEDFFLDAHYAESTVSDSIRRSIGQPFFPDPQMDLTQVGLVLGYNLLPGEIFVGRRWAMPSYTYILGGVANTSFNDEDYLTYQVGFGIRVLPWDFVAVRLEARDSVWESDLLGGQKWTNNFEMTLGLDFVF